MYIALETKSYEKTRGKRNSTKMHDLYIGPYIVTEVRNYGTVCASRGNVTDIYNLRNITTFKE